MDFLEDCVLGSVFYNHDLIVIFIMPLASFCLFFFLIYFWISWFLDLYHKIFHFRDFFPPSV